MLIIISQLTLGVIAGGRDSSSNVIKELDFLTG